MRQWLVGLWLLLVWVSATAQVSGVVVDDESGQPISGVMVKVIVEGKTKAFATSNAQGKFSIPKATPPCTLAFNHLSYEPFQAKVTDSQLRTYQLTPSNRELKDLVVEAPRIVQHGDTTVYHLGRFVSQRDVTLQDALKKLPGVEVSKGGSISYLGRAVDKLTIDNMDVLGRDYQSTIQNLRYDKVARVEIMENQQDIKMLKDLVSDDKIVMNLVLNHKARGRANGKAEIGAGVDSQKELAYRGMGYLLYAQPRWQSTVEGRLDKDFNATDEVKHSVITPLMPSSPLLSSLPMGLSAPEPSLSPHFYLRQRGGQGKAKTIYQFSTDRTLKADLSYSDYTSRHSYGNELTFFAPSKAEDVVLNEHEVHTRSREQLARAMLEYKRNERNNYLNETVEYVGLRQHQKDQIFRSATPMFQEIDLRSHLVQNQLSWSQRFGRKVLSFHSKLSYQNAPLLSLSAPLIEQKFSEEVMRASLSTSFLFPLKKGWQLAIPIEGSYVRDKIHKDGAEYTQGQRWDLKVSPRLWRFSLGDNNISFELPTTLAVLKYGEADRASHLLLSPSLNYMYRLNRVWHLFGMVNYYQEVGSLLDLMRQPFFTTYRQERLGAGELTSSQGLYASINLKFRQPVQELYGTITLSGRYGRSDHFLTDNPTVDLNRLELVKGDNTYGNYQLNSYISRYFRKIKSKVSAGFSANYAHYQTMRREVEQTSQMMNLSTWGEVQCDLAKHWSGKLSYNVARSQMWYATQKLDPLHTLLGTLDVTYSPTDDLHLTLLCEHQGKEWRMHEMKHLFLLSTVGEYRTTIGNFKLHLHNLLNQQEYGFTSYSATESNRSWYQLRGRSALLSYLFYF